MARGLVPRLVRLVHRVPLAHLAHRVPLDRLVLRDHRASNELERNI